MQKFQLSAAVCKKLLRPVFKTINHSAVLPSLEGVMIDNCDGGIRFTASDLENTLSATLPLSGLSPMAFCVHGKKLSGVINNAIEDSISVKLGKQKLSFDTGGFGLSVPANSVDEYPKSPVLEKPRVLIMDSAILYGELAKAIRFASNDDLRPSMTGVCLTDYKGELHIVATDAHRLFWKGVIKTPKSMIGISAIIPQKSVRLFLETFKSGNVEISLTEQHVRFYSATYTLVSRLIDSKYPMFSQVIPENTIQFCFIRKQMSAFLRMAAPFVNRSTNCLNVIVKNDYIHLGGGDIDFDNEISYKIPVYNTLNMPAEISFSMNLKFLQDHIAISKDEYCKILHSGQPTRPIVIDDCSLLMPIMNNL